MASPTVEFGFLTVKAIDNKSLTGYYCFDAMNEKLFVHRYTADSIRNPMNPDPAEYLN